VTREEKTMPNLRNYVRHGELYGGYDSVFEEAAKEGHVGRSGVTNAA